MKRQLVMAFICLLTFAVPVIAQDGVKYDKGELNIKCTCEKFGKEKYTWHHVIKIPRNGFTINLNDVCKTVRDNYTESDILCKKDDDYLGKEHAYEPE